MKTKSIFAKHYLGILLTILISFLIFTLFFSAISYNFICSDKQKNISATTEVVSAAAAAKNVENELASWDFRLTVSSIGAASGTHISVCDPNGRVVVCSDDEVFCRHIGSNISLVTLRTLSEEEYCTLTSLDGYYSSLRYTFCSVIKDPYNDDTVGYTLTSIDMKSIVKMWKGVFWIFALIELIVLIGVMIIFYVTVGRQIKPLKDMAQAARAFGGGDMTVRVSGYDRHDEVGELEEAFNQMAESLESSEKRRKEFIANISHELKTPMTTIAGYADGMLDGTIPWENRERYLGIIADETRRMSRLIRKMLDLSRFQSRSEEILKNARCDVCETVRMAILSLENRIEEKRLNINAQIPDERINVRGEQDSVMQIAYNIIDNAVKFSYPSSELMVRIWKSEAKVYVSVKNEGDVIPQNELPYIFDRFHKSDKSRSEDKEGVGLGLYIVKSIISDYGEKISVRSENGETEFTFSLSAAE